MCSALITMSVSCGVRDRCRKAVERAGGRRNLCGDVACAPDHGEGAAAAGRARLRHACLLLAYYALVALGLGDRLGPVIGQLAASAAMRTVLVDFSGLAMAAPLENSASVIPSGALALAVIASIDASLCAKLTSAPDELRSGDDGLLVRLGIANAISAGFGGITSGINIGPSQVNRAFGGRSLVSVHVNAAVLLVAATVLAPALAYLPGTVLSAPIMVVAIQHIEPWTRQLALREIDAALHIRGIRLALVLSGRTETAARLADIFQGERFFPDIDRAIEWAEDDLLRKAGTAPSAALPLDHLPLLGDLSADQIERLRGRLDPVAWPAGQMVFRQRRPRLGALSRHARPRQRPYPSRRRRHPPRYLRGRRGVRRTRAARPRPALLHAYPDEDLEGFGPS